MTSSYFIDVHAHLDDEKFSEDVSETVARAIEANVKKIINVGCSIAECQKVIELAEENADCYCIVGIHPHNAEDFEDNCLGLLKNYAKHSKCLGIGEIGLDYFYEFAPKKLQIEAFQKQWELAAKLGLPTELHIRDAYDDFFPSIKNLPKPPKVMLHCFSGDIEIAKKALDMGFDFSVGGFLTFKKSEATREVFKYIPIDRIHLETDCPYLAPQGQRGKRNEPAFVSITAEYLANIKNCSVEQLKEILYENAKNFFGEKLGL